MDQEAQYDLGVRLYVFDSNGIEPERVGYPGRGVRPCD